MSNRPKLVGGNWKMNGNLESLVMLTNDLLDECQSARCDMVIFPPSVYLSAVQSLVSETDLLNLGAQNINSAGEGAFTGEISTAMIADMGCRFALVGHSERRQLYGESNQMVAEKFAACVAQGISPVLCIGETLEQRNAGQTDAVVGAQLQQVLEYAGIDQFTDACVAYEPVWAIGTGISAEPHQAAEVHELIRGILVDADAVIGEDLRIIYGGSVTQKNAAELFNKDNIDGALVGGASLNAAGFAEICRLAS